MQLPGRMFLAVLDAVSCLLVTLASFNSCTISDANGLVPSFLISCLRCRGDNWLSSLGVSCPVSGLKTWGGEMGTKSWMCDSSPVIQKLLSKLRVIIQYLSHYYFHHVSVVYVSYAYYYTDFNSQMKPLTLTLILNEALLQSIDLK